MSSPGGDWRNGPAYEYFDDLGPDQVAFEFLRRNENYAAECAQLSESSRNGDPPPPLAQWGLRFRGRSATPVRSGDSRLERAIRSTMAIFTSMPPDLCDGPALALVNPSVLATSAEGSYLDLLALPPTRRALLLGEAAAGAVALVLPLDRLFEDRIDTARRLHRLLVSGRATPSTFTAYRRRRLRLALRALDGTLDGADYRAVAEVLFGDRVPRGAAWRGVARR